MELGISAGCGINFSEFGRHLFFFLLLRLLLLS